MMSVPSRSCTVLAVATVGTLLSVAPRAFGQDCASLPEVPTGSTTATQDRDRMLCIQGITIPTLPPRLEDPNRPTNAFPRNPAAPEGNWTDPRGHTVVRTAFGQWHTYDSGTAANPLPEGGAMSGFGDYGPESTPRYTDIELLKMEDGAAVASPEDWWIKRRPEVFDLVQRQLYGRAWDPSVWPAITWTVGPVTTGTQTVNGVGYPWHQKTITGTISIDTFSPRNRPSLSVTCRLPALAATEGVEVPVILYFGSATTAFGFTAPYGIGGCQFNQAALQPDSGGQALSSFIIGLINKGQWRKPEDPGALVAWAWGISRVIDYFETTDAEIDGDKVGVAGHSRFGKATLVAAAYDQRVVAAYPSCGGSLGTSWARRAYGETLEFVASSTSEYHWVNGNIMNYMGPLNPGNFWPRKVELLDVDTHSIMSLIAPRAVFTNGGTDNVNGNADAWQDPRGMFLAGKMSSPVWEFLGWPGQVIPPDTVFTTDPSTVYPPVGAPATYRLIDESAGGTPPFNVAFIDGTVGYRRHGQGHTDAPGWPSFAQFAARFLNDKRPVVTPATLSVPAVGSDSLGTLAATDADDATLGNWLVTGGTGAYKFKLDRQTGEITIPDRSVLDPAVTSHTLAVTVSDGKLMSHAEEIEINVPPDAAAPATVATANPGPNANGWNVGDVTVSLSAQDVGVAGLKEINVALTGAQTGSQTTAGPTAQVTVSAEGVTLVSFFSTDNFGNAEPVQTLTVRIDRTPPTIVATASPAANAAGWHRSPVTVTFTCADNLALAACPPGVAITAEGAGQVAAGLATDLAGHSASASITINLDLTAAEAAVEFDPAVRDVRPVVLDALSGPTPVAPPTVQAIRWDDDDDDHGDHDDDDHHGDHDDDDGHGADAQRRIYVLRDVAGNATTLIVDVRKSGRTLQARVTTIRYNDGKAKTVETNELRYEWVLANNGALRTLSQEARVGSRDRRRETDADYDARRNVTVIRVRSSDGGHGNCRDDDHHGHDGSVETRPGLVLLRLQTRKGALEIVI